MVLNDEQFFAAFPERQTRIRLPDPYNEMHREFHGLGDHPAHRRRILLWKVPKENPSFDPKRPQILKIPFLAFADETIENTDDVLIPILHTLMSEQLDTAGRA